MITKRDLEEAIAECQGVRDPNANTCIKLAAYYVILDHLNKEVPLYSYAPQSAVQRLSVAYTGDSEFAQKIYGMDCDKVMSVMDELMSTVSILNPNLYNGVMRKLSE